MPASKHRPIDRRVPNVCCFKESVPLVVSLRRKTFVRNRCRPLPVDTFRCYFPPFIVHQSMNSARDKLISRLLQQDNLRTLAAGSLQAQEL